MAEHYTKATESVLRWCNKCNCLTQHRVNSGRIGSCMEHQAAELSRKQQHERERREDEARNPRMF